MASRNLLKNHKYLYEKTNFKLWTLFSQYLLFPYETPFLGDYDCHNFIHFKVVNALIICYAHFFILLAILLSCTALSIFGNISITENGRIPSSLTLLIVLSPKTIIEIVRHFPENFFPKDFLPKTISPNELFPRMYCKHLLFNIFKIIFVIYCFQQVW